MKSIAAIFAHPDDAEIWAGGTLKKHVDLNYNVKSYMFYELSQIRCAESEEALNFLSISASLCRTESYKPPKFSLFKKLIHPLPDIIITHWESDSHIEHKLIFDLSLLFAHHMKRYYKKTPLLLMSSTYNLLGTTGMFQPSIIMDISEQMQTKEKAIKCHKSQNPNRILNDVRAQNTIFGLQIKRKYGEGFIEYPLFGTKNTRKYDQI